MATLLGLGEQVLYLSLPTQMALKASVDSIARKLDDMMLTKQDALIVDILSSSCLMGSDEWGCRWPPSSQNRESTTYPGAWR